MEVVTDLESRINQANLLLDSAHLNDHFLRDRCLVKHDLQAETVFEDSEKVAYLQQVTLIKTIYYTLFQH